MDLFILTMVLLAIGFTAKHWANQSDIQIAKDLIERNKRNQ